MRKTYTTFACFITAIAICIGLSGCGETKVSASELEQQKKTAVENAELNAQMFRANDTSYASHKIITNPDSTQKLNCPMGDGWATLELVDPATGRKTKLKCSTYSAATGCLLDTVFVTKPYAPDDGKCQSETVPYPIEKLSK